MFDKFKQLKQLKDLQNSLKEEKEEASKEGVRVIVNGKMEIEKIELSQELSKEQQEIIVKDCINEAMKKIQVIAAQKMSQMQGFGL